MFLIVGLGNPGINYQYTRHNIGFMAVEEIAFCHKFPPFLNSKKFLAEISEGIIDQERVLLVKPTTFMNLSGNAIQRIKSYYKLELANIIIIHDDLDLAFNKVKVKIGGSNGGHNGLRSIDSHIGKEYLRIRIGIGRPQLQEEVSNYVLSGFSKSELTEIKEQLGKISSSLSYILSGTIDQFLLSLSR